MSGAIRVTGKLVIDENKGMGLKVNGEIAEIEPTPVVKENLREGQTVLVKIPITWLPDVFNPFEIFGTSGDVKYKLSDIVAILPEEVKEEPHCGFEGVFGYKAKCSQCSSELKEGTKIHLQPKEPESEIDFAELRFNPEEYKPQWHLEEKFNLLIDIVEKMWKEKKNGL